MNVFLDLEKTIIEDWTDHTLLIDNIKKIKKQLNNIDIKTLNIFSMAITSDKDIETFNRLIRKDIEKLFNIKIKSIIKIDNKFVENMAKLENIPFFETDFMTDIFQRNPKEELFEIFIKHNFKNEASILFDDMVSNSKKQIFDNSPLEINENSTTIIFIKV